MRPISRTLALASLALVQAWAHAARADAIGPAPHREDCPPGTMSVVPLEVLGGHGMFAACAPRLCREGATCGPGERCVLVTRSVMTHAVGGGGGHGAPFRPPTGTFPDVGDTCAEPVGDVVERAPDAPSAAGPFEPPEWGAITGGCRRLRLCVADAEAATLEPVAGEPPAARADVPAEPVVVAVPVAPAPVAPAPEALSTPAAEARPTAAAGGCTACSVHGGAEPSWGLALTLLLVLARARPARRARRAR